MAQPYADALTWVPKSRTLAATLARAFDYAKAQTHPAVSLEHLLLALVTDADASLVLQACSVDLGRLNADASTYLAGVQPTAGPELDPAAGEDLLRILDYASAAARQSRRREINGAIVLAAIVGDGRSPAASMLRAQGLTFEEAIKALQRASTGVARPAPEPAGAPMPPAPARPPPSSPAPDLRSQVPSPAHAVGAARPEEGGETWRAPPASPGPPRHDPMLNGGGAHSAEELLASARRRVESGREPARPAVQSSTPEARVTEDGSPPHDGGRAGHPGNGAENALHAPEPPPRDLSPPEPRRTMPRPDPAAQPQARPSPAPAPPQQPWAPNDYADRELPPGGSAPEGSPPYQPPHSEPARPVRPPPVPPPMPPPYGASPAAAYPRPQGPRSMPPTDYGRVDHHGGPAGAPPYPQHEPPGLSRPPGVARRPPPRPGSDRQGPPRQAAELAPGQLVENIPRRMTAGVAVSVEVRIANADVRALAEGLHGPGVAYHHEVIITKAMSVRLRAPEGDFWIEPTSPETQWIESQLALMSDDYASWRWTIMPQRRGRARLQLVVSARTVGGDGLAAETALPDQIIDIKVRTNYGQVAGRLLGWVVAAAIGGIIGKFGEVLFALARPFL